jgi:AraC-like DNA-binding protein/mannose-6-phosphate isomerase-like protein (cupin superfamily)
MKEIPLRPSDFPVVHLPELTRAVRAAVGHPKPPPRGAMAVFTVARAEMRAGESDVWHTHHELWELLVQAEGVTREHFGGRPFEFRPGDLVIIPARTPHGTLNDNAHSIYQYTLHFEVNDVPLVEQSPHFRVTPGRPLCRLGRDELLWFEQLFHQLWWEETMRPHGFEWAQDALLRLIFIGIERQLAAAGHPNALLEKPRPEVMRFLNHVRDSIAEPQPLQAAARKMGASYDSLRHRFKHEIGLAPQRFLMDLRMQQAKHLLLTTRLTIKEIANRVGYADAHHFTAAFTRQVGLAPLYWRKRPRLGKE